VTTRDPWSGNVEGLAVSRSEKQIEILATVLLAFAALATAWSGYQASLWDGVQSSNYSRASAARTEAAQKHTAANQRRLADLSVLENFVDATLDGDTELAAFYRRRFSADLEPAYEAWAALDPWTSADAPPSPLVMPEYRPAQEREADQLTDRAEGLFTEGEDARASSDDYTASTLFFASVLFFAAISERFEYRRARIALLAIGGIGLLLGTGFALTQPITWG
jgi:hypothetical protein